MDSYVFSTFKIRSDLLKKVEIISNHFNNRNYYYIQNLKDFIDYYINNNSFNIENNNHLNNLKNNMDRWNINIIGSNQTVINDFTTFIYNYDSSDNEMNDFINQLNKLI